MLNILTIDVEDYYHVSAFESEVRREDWDKYESRVVDNTKRLLAILRDFDVKATFFILGWVAERYPEIVRDIVFDGHEIACHGYAHRLIYNQSNEVFREDLLKSKTILEEIISEAFYQSRIEQEKKIVNQFRIPKVSIRKLLNPSSEFRIPQVVGYRAASYSITEQSL